MQIKDLKPNDIVRLRDGLFVVTDVRETTYTHQIHVEGYGKGNANTILLQDPDYEVETVPAQLTLFRIDAENHDPDDQFGKDQPTYTAFIAAETEQAAIAFFDEKVGTHLTPRIQVIGTAAETIKAGVLHYDLAW